MDPLSVLMTGGTGHDEVGRSKQKYDQVEASNYRSIVVKQGETPIGARQVIVFIR
jgi:hypothetical protein